MTLAFAALLVTVFGGAASARTEQASELNIMGFGPGDDVANSRAEVAENALPRGSRVDNPRGGFNIQRFLAALAARDVPDLIYLNRQDVASLAARNALQPMTSCVRSQRVDLRQYRRAALQEITYRGQLYGLPEFSNQRTIIVNNDVLRAAGVRAADIQTRNWARLRAANRKMLRREGGRVTRIGFDPKIPEFFPLWTKALGHDLISKDGRRAFLDHPKSIQALTFTYSLIRDHGGFGPFKAFRDTWDFFGRRNQVAENQIGAWPMESWYYNVLAQNSPNVDITAKYFTNTRGGPITFFTGNAWAIPRGARDADLACIWAKTMTRWETWMVAARNRRDIVRRRGQPFTGLYTANTTADVKIYEDVFQPTGRRGFDNAVRLLVQSSRYAFPLPASPAGTEINQALTDAINRVLAGQQTPRQALRQAQREANAALRRRR